MRERRLKFELNLIRSGKYHRTRIAGFEQVPASISASLFEYSSFQELYHSTFDFFTAALLNGLREHFILAEQLFPETLKIETYGVR